MSYFVFRNMTVERLFQGVEATFSGYEDISEVPAGAERYVWCYLAPYKADSGVVAAEIAAYADRLRLTLGRIGGGRMVIALTMRDLFPFRVTARDRVERAAREYNDALYALADQYPNLKVVDFAGFMADYPREEWIDWKYYFLSQMPVNPRLAAAFGRWFERQTEIIEMKRKKCLVLDLDNTLWGGILGEDGVAGVRIGGDYPGNAYLAFQQYLLELSGSGVILAACSKNNEADVRELWREHPANLLRGEHFAAVRINWQDKASNIREIARELNIGLDSMVFIDDNPTERELVRGLVPEVAVPDFPDHPYQLPEYVARLTERYFTVYALTDEDRGKTEQYKTKALRDSQQALFADFDDYVRSLEIRLTIAGVTPLTIGRAAQMTQKTNQFNLTTRRYTDADIQELIRTGARVVTLGAADKFGDNGITGLMIVTFGEHRTAVIDTLLMSCRILGKGIEYAFVSHVIRQLFAEGTTAVEASYIPTARNGQVADFYPKLGFRETPGGKYLLSPADFIACESGNYTITEQ